MRLARRLVPSCLVVVLLCAGCGGDPDRPRGLAAAAEAAKGGHHSGGSASASAGGGASADAERVVRAWADTLRRGDVAGAARYFALPSVVANGTAPIRLKTRAEAEFFNRTLPCGSRVVRAAPAAHGFIIVTFRLTERPGRGSCGSGAGGTARAAFLVENGRITHWLRVADVAEGPRTMS